MKNSKCPLLVLLIGLGWQGATCMADEPEQNTAIMRADLAWKHLVADWHAQAEANIMRSPQTFEQALQQVYLHYPHLRTGQQSATASQQNNIQRCDDQGASDPYQSACKVMNMAVIAYMMVRILAAYHTVYNAGSVPSEMGQEGFITKYVGNAVVWLLPSALYNTYKMTCFLSSVVAISLRTVLYRSAAKFVLFCCYADVGDLAESATSRLKRFVSR